MSSEYIILHDSPHTETQAWEAAIETPTRKRTLALAKPESTFPDSGFLTPNAVKSLVEQQLQIYVQYGFGNHNPFSDADYADAGAEFTRHYADLSMLSNIVLKFDAFTLDQIALAKEKQTLFSMLSPEMFTPEYVEELPPVERQLFLNFGREEEEAKLQAAAKSDGKMFNLGDAEDFDDFDFG